ncbi:MAG: thermonuclease family protein [Verrucomicrobiota bacterium]
MARHPSQPKKTSLVVLVILFAAAWYINKHFISPNPSPTPSGDLPAITDSRFESLSNTTLINSGGNDGDSFKVRLPNGDEETFRLYFVDTPETSDRYPDRLRYQAEYFDDLTSDQTITIGKEAKAFTLDLLESHPFVILTRWEKVMQSYRNHAFVLVETQPDQFEYLSEILVRNGLARIYTMPHDLPDGTPKEKFKSHLKSLEKNAQSTQSGAWRF